MFGNGASSSLTPARWAGIGAAVAVSLGAGGVGLIAHAAGSSTPSSFVAITPCRLFDTRPGEPVGDRLTPLNADETLVRQVTGTNGNCTIPAGATAINYNLTIPDGLDGFLTLYPADTGRPNASTINPVTGQGVKVNGGTVGLSATGAIALYSLRGPINAVLDITGYYVPAATGGGAAGPAGTPGAPGAAGTPGLLGTNGINGTPGTNGTNGTNGKSPWDTIPVGQTVTGSIVYDTHQDGATSDAVGVDLPGVAPVALDDTTVNVATPGALDEDAACTGTFDEPTAPAGQICIYIVSNVGVDLATVAGVAGLLPTRSFMVTFDADGLDPDEVVYATWAYTA